MDPLFPHHWANGGEDFEYTNDFWCSGYRNVDKSNNTKRNLPVVSCRRRRINYLLCQIKYLLLSREQELSHSFPKSYGCLYGTVKRQFIFGFCCFFYICRYSLHFLLLYWISLQSPLGLWLQNVFKNINEPANIDLAVGRNWVSFHIWMNYPF